LPECAALLKTTPKDVTTKINKIIQQQKTLEKEVEKFKGLPNNRKIPLILKFLGEFLHAGKATTFGLGKHEVM